MPPPTAAKIDLYFYRSAGGNEPVRDWLKALPEDQRREVGLDLQRVQYRWPIGMPFNGERTLGSANRVAWRQYRARFYLFSCG